jgi:hypothetical protein
MRARALVFVCVNCICCCSGARVGCVRLHAHTDIDDIDYVSEFSLWGIRFRYQTHHHQ